MATTMEKKLPRKPLSPPEQRKLKFQRDQYYVEKDGFWMRNPAKFRVDKSIDFEPDAVTPKRFESFDAAVEYEEQMIRARVPGRNNWEIRDLDFEETVIDQHQEVQETLGEVSEHLREHVAPQVGETNENVKKLLAFQEGFAKEAIEVAQRREALAEKRKAQNEAFASRVEAGDATPLEEKKLRLKILAEEIRRQEAEQKVEKQREKMRKRTEKEEKAAEAAVRKAASTGTRPPKRRASKLTTTGDAPPNPADYPTIDSPEMAAFLEAFVEFQHGTDGPARGIFKIPAAGSSRSLPMPPATPSSRAGPVGSAVTTLLWAEQACTGSPTRPCSRRARLWRTVSSPTFTGAAPWSASPAPASSRTCRRACSRSRRD